MEKLSNIIRYLERLAPPSLQEDYDNSGLIVGQPDMEIHGAIICLDSTEAVIDEAIRKIEAVNGFLRQAPNAAMPFAQMLTEMGRAVA